jgi:hypothetical protein
VAEAIIAPSATTDELLDQAQSNLKSAFFTGNQLIRKSIPRLVDAGAFGTPLATQLSNGASRIKSG